MPADIKERIKSIYEIMKEENICELEVKSKDCNIYIKRKDNTESEFVALKKQQHTTTESVTEKFKDHCKVSTSVVTIKSPLAGVFYRSSSPLSKVYVNDGDIIEIGTTVCIIEAMKVMNEIKATFKAKISKILIENGAPVNSGQDLFEVEKM
ncbi:MAG: hypothetical protein LBC05_00750 [Endomicrobium sp.]|jgi:acetyl-CoA carboxylase biotin carboxyl carrier protein|nr:hypothetical protein [Endomicrobium sp.]